MPTAWVQNYYHAVFSTKGRAPAITPEVESRLHPFIGGVLRDLGCTMLAINGAADHVHILVRYPSNLSHSDMIRHIKSRSSKWLHETFPALRGFAWQEGYGGFTVSQSKVVAVRAYIANQKEHHATRDFRTEYLELLRRHEITFDDASMFG